MNHSTKFKHIATSLSFSYFIIIISTHMNHKKNERFSIIFHAKLNSHFFDDNNNSLTTKGNKYVKEAMMIAKRAGRQILCRYY